MDALAPAGASDSLVPEGFPAYVRLFHPAYEDGGGPDERQLRWADVANRVGTTMHGLAQFSASRQRYGHQLTPRKGAAQ